ncbi:acyltransferase [Paraburkholderia phytofirmans]|uniref:acyltransferase family protein n=1 Tax=Paraburkholderia phytofirmans TaxID=261302 RepID=UPI0038B8CA6B
MSPENSAFIASSRGGAALLVLVAHMQQVYLGPIGLGFHPYRLLVSQLAVMVFFVLSGFLIGKSITAKTSVGDYRFSRYGLDRAWRILPPLALSFVVMVVLAYLAPVAFPSGGAEYLPEKTYVVIGAYTLHVRELLTATLFLNGFFGDNPLINGPLWSLAYEVWLYALAGAAVVFRKSRPGQLAIVATLVVLVARNPKFGAYGLVWTAGFALCLAHNNGVLRSLRRPLGMLAAAFTVIALAFGSLYVGSYNRTSDIHLANFHYVVLFNLFLGLSYACMLAAVLDRSTRSLRPLAASSAFSYTLYIVHFPILLFVFGVFQLPLHSSHGAVVAVWIASLIGVILFSAWAAKLVENKRAMQGIFFRISGVLR